VLLVAAHAVTPLVHALVQHAPALHAPFAQADDVDS
jgi:hypothetical protein